MGTLAKIMNNVQLALKELFAETMQSILEAELDTELNYEKHDNKNKATRNRQREQDHRDAGEVRQHMG